MRWIWCVSQQENGLGLEPNNLAAIRSLIGYRALRYGKHLDLIITDQHSYRSPDPFSDDSLGKLGDWADFPEFSYTITAPKGARLFVAIESHDEGLRCTTRTGAKRWTVP